MPLQSSLETPSEIKILNSGFQMKRISLFLFLISFLISALSTPLSSGWAAERKVPLILDTDMGTDDWLAFAFIAKNPKYDLLGISVVGNGLSPCPQAANNASYLLGLVSKKDVPVACGSNWPMDGYASYPKPWRDITTTMRGEDLPIPNILQIYGDSSALLVELLQKSSDPVEILALGAMTNIATTIKARPKLKKKIKRITAMGGAVYVPGNLRVPGFTDQLRNTKAEWNFYIDPVAAKIVFQSGIPIRLVPLDATNLVPLTVDFVQRVKALPASPLQEFTARTLNRVSNALSTGEYYHWDPLAAVVADDPGICSYSLSKKFIISARLGNDYGIDNGIARTFFPTASSSGRKRFALSDKDAGASILDASGSMIDVCMEVPPAVFEQKYLDMLGRS